MLTRLRPAILLALLPVALAACGGSTSDDPNATSSAVDGGLSDAAIDAAIDSAPDTPDAVIDAPLACAPQATSSLPHVHLDVHPTKCTFTLAEAAAGITIPYELIIDEDVPGFVPAYSYPYGPDVASLDLTEKVTGGGQSYCECDLGIPKSVCPTADGGLVSAWPCEPITLPKGSYARTFSWDGRNWGGPSDTANPKGPPFPAGDYALTIQTNEGRFDEAGPTMRAQATLPLRLVP